MKSTTRMRTLECPDGTIAFLDPGTEVKKKNRSRHVKDEAPKSMRGIPVERRNTDGAV